MAVNIIWEQGDCFSYGEGYHKENYGIVIGLKEAILFTELDSRTLEGPKITKGEIPSDACPLKKQTGNMGILFLIQFAMKAVRITLGTNC